MAWVLHRVTGIAIFLFLLAHIVDTAVVGFGSELYDRVVGVYRNPLVRALEIGLAGTIIFHAINGVKVMILDFWPRASDRHRELFWGVLALSAVLLVPVLFFMGREFLGSF